MTVTLAAEASEWALVGGAGWKSAASEHVNCAQQDDSHDGHFSLSSCPLRSAGAREATAPEPRGAHGGGWVRSH
jgi:hypothetical protein